jgi:hypothetical protein
MNRLEWLLNEDPCRDDIDCLIYFGGGLILAITAFILLILGVGKIIN